jgi:hypothetical protein
MVVDHVRSLGRSFRFVILGVHVRIDCPDAALRRILVANFGAMSSTDVEPPVDLDYSVICNEGVGSFSLVRDGQAALDGSGLSDFLYLLEKDVTVELQKRRADLLFLHSAAIDWQGRACLIAAESGRGKSTTTWALLHHEFGYLSDELSPIDLNSMQVFPYPHALCLKRLPPGYPLPKEALHLGRTIHVQTRFLPTAVIPGPRPLGAVFFVHYRPDISAPELRAISPAAATARLYVTALNPLAHPNRGLDAAVRIAEHVPCYMLSSAGLPATCALIRAAAQRGSGSLKRGDH